MKDEIVFLGTGGDEYVISKNIRSAGGIIIRTEGYQFHIDPGPGSLVYSNKHDVNLRETTAVLISHSHINHCNDINAVLAAMSHNKLDTKGVLIAPDTVVNGNENENPVLTKFHRGCVERIIVPKAGQKIGIEDIEIHLLKAKHTDPETMGFKFITPKFILSYSSDTRYNPELIKEYEGSDILILNVVSPFEKKQEFNLNCDDAVNIIKRVNPKLAIVTHFGKDMIESNPSYQAREIHRLTGTTIIAAEEGTSVNPLAYASKTRQKKLEKFESPDVQETLS